MSSKQGEDVVSGIHTDALLENDPPAFRVTWIDWDSDFRRELRFNDLIVAINKQPLTQLLQPGKMSKGVGQPAEGQYWQEIQARAGDEIELTVVRDDHVTSVKGRLATNWFHYDGEGKPALAPGGPARMATDGSAEPWMFWLEKLQNRLSRILTEGWRSRSFNNRRELGELLEDKPRIDLLLERWPGAFAQSLHDDWSRALEVTRGRIADPPVDLEYRALGERRIEVARAEAARAWSAILDETGGDHIPAKPAGSPLERDRWVGKIVEFPPLSFRDFHSDMGKSFAAAGSPQDGYWYLLFERPEMQAFWMVFYRYKGQVNPRVAERFRFLVRVLDDAQMFTVKGHSVMGLGVQALAVFAGDDELFVNLGVDSPRFAGEDALSSFQAVQRDDADPASVVAAMIEAIKMGDEPAWRSSFAPWAIVAGAGGRPMLDMAYATSDGMFSRPWDRSRFLIMSEVLDARVAHVDNIRRVLDRDAETGLPDVEHVTVWVDHFGLFDNEERAFQNTNVNRRWELQRLDGGPWRIVSIQSI